MQRCMVFSAFFDDRSVERMNWKKILVKYRSSYFGSVELKRNKIVS